MRSLWARDAAHLLEVVAHLHDVPARARAVVGLLLGRSYLANALIGSRSRAERLVLDLGGFDCVTLIENTLALAHSATPEDAAAAIVRMRYRRGEITWASRLHYFSDWLTWNRQTGVLRPVRTGPGVRVVESVPSLVAGLPVRRRRLFVYPRRAVLHAARATGRGAVVAFASTRARLDYFHVGLLFWDVDGAIAGTGRSDSGASTERLMLYHAVRSTGAVTCEPLMRFLQRTRTRGLHISVLRERARGGRT